MEYLFKFYNDRCIILDRDCQELAAFEFCLQPIFRPKNKSVYAFELLSKVHFHSGEYYANDDFFDSIDDNFMKELLILQMSYAAEHLVESDIKLTFNIPVSCLYDGEFIKRLINNRRGNYVIEVGDIASYIPSKDLINNLKSLKLSGIEVWLDEYDVSQKENNQCLDIFPWDGIKVDKNFLYFIGDEVKLSPLVGILKLYTSKVIVEGVETNFQRNFVILNNTLAQGYFYSYPVDFAQANRMIQEQQIHLESSSNHQELSTQNTLKPVIL